MAGIMDFLRNNSDALMSTGAGLLGGGNTQEQISGGMQGFVQARRQNKTLNMLRKENPELAQAVENGALSGNDAFKLHYSQKMEAQKPKNPIEINGRLVDPTNYQVLADFSTKPEGLKPTDDMREYEFAKGQGFDGNFTDYMTQMKKASAMNINNGGVQLPAEMGARIGLGDQFTSELPGIKDQIKDGAISGPIERAQFAAGVGTPAQIWRRIETGKEALVRNLTGAGMAQAEAENQAARYQISATDSADTMLQKLEGLERDLNATRSGAIGARTGNLSNGPLSGQGQPAAGVVDYTDYFK